MLEGVPGIGHWELIALAVVVVLLFGSKQVPFIGRSLGTWDAGVQGDRRPGGSA